MTKSAPFVMEKMAETKRFSDVKLRCYVNEIRDEEQFQFSAVCVELPDDSLYVAFLWNGQHDHGLAGRF